HAGSDPVEERGPEPLAGYQRSDSAESCRAVGLAPHARVPRDRGGAVRRRHHRFTAGARDQRRLRPRAPRGWRAPGRRQRADAAGCAEAVEGAHRGRTRPDHWRGPEPFRCRRQRVLEAVLRHLRQVLHPVGGDAPEGSSGRRGTLEVNRAIRLCDGALEAGLVALMVLAPLPEGSVRSLREVMMAGVVGLLITLSIIRMLLAGELRVCLSPVLWPGLAMAGLVGWQMLSPSGSVDPHATRESARLFFAYLGLLLVVSMLPMTRARATRLMGALVVSAVILAGVGFARQIGFAEAWLGHPAVRLTSTFINPNHQALYFSLALFVSLGLVLRPSGRGVGAPGTARRRQLPAHALLTR